MKRILFVTGTRADYGKLKSLIKIVQKSDKFKCYVFVTGMHTIKKYGSTFLELKKDKIKNIFIFDNQKKFKSMSLSLAETIKGFNIVRKKIQPDLTIVHGDRIEPMACALDCVLNNSKVAHVEGGEVSGTVDEMIRHSISKIAQFHFVTNSTAKKRLIQMGEKRDSIFVIGSPDIDTILSKKLPKIEVIKKKYEINFDSYSIVMLHPVTTDVDGLKNYARIFFSALKKSKKKYVIIYPNNDLGSDIIIKEIEKLKKNSFFKILPSMRFEYFLSLLKNSQFIIGNSSAGIIEAPYYGVKTINVGNRQKNRFRHKSIINLKFNEHQLLKNIHQKNKKFKTIKYFGYGKSDKNFYKILVSKKIWKLKVQKYFNDLI
ncbi:UDP-N-acetylglucosamine 2-epimerase [Candidatus Pelagibacter sp. HIMB1521]|uniref:UDP-N-acetylglucosamine 2-epimerase n=1 Tax=Candidatus Pelagibacter sp. HIMB1521 TaxID=3413344 RepID=UPI003F86ED3C